MSLIEGIGAAGQGLNSAMPNLLTAARDQRKENERQRAISSPENQYKQAVSAQALDELKKNSQKFSIDDLSKTNPYAPFMIQEAKNDMTIMPGQTHITLGEAKEKMKTYLADENKMIPWTQKLMDQKTSESKNAETSLAVEQEKLQKLQQDPLGNKDKIEETQGKIQNYTQVLGDSKKQEGELSGHLDKLELSKAQKYRAKLKGQDAIDFDAVLEDNKKAGKTGKNMIPTANQMLAKKNEQQGKSQSEEQLTARALKGDKEAQQILDQMQKRRLEIAKTQREIPEKMALDAVKSTLNDPVAGPMMMSGALAQGLSPENFAAQTQASRGIQGSEAKSYLMKTYANYVKQTFPALPASKIGGFLAARENAYKANLATQRKATEFATLNDRAIEQATTMNNILQKESGVLTQSGSRPRSALNAWGKSAWNDPQYGRFMVALNSYLSEYMKVVSGGALSVQQITDSARTKGQELLRDSDSFESLNGKLDIMRQEMDGTKKSWDDAVSTTYGAGGSTDITQPPAVSGTGGTNKPLPTF